MMNFHRETESIKINEMMNWKKAFIKKMQKNITNNLVKLNAEFTVKFWGNWFLIKKWEITLIINIH